MPDYRKLYLTLMCEVEKSVEILINAQRKCEDMYINSENSIVQIANLTQNSPNEKTADETEKF